MKYDGKQIFRKSSIVRVSSPDQLNDYIRVSNPSVWMMLTAVIVLLAGVCVWGIFGHLESKILSAGACKNGTFICYVTGEDAAKIKTGMMVKVNGNDFAVSEISERPIAVSADMDSYLMYLGDFSEGEWMYEVSADVDIPDGTYKAEIVTESVSPISFILN
ncbi:MAG: hypothetical protein HFH36_13580 [Lachnospiraceae bacterium]|jgi:hypothetical protein|nr:hypothetical protein [Lachnospiraceae bacterium]